MFVQKQTFKIILFVQNVQMDIIQNKSLGNVFYVQLNFNVCNVIRKILLLKIIGKKKLELFIESILKQKIYINIQCKNINFDYIQNAQSQNVKDYEIICSSCQDGYKLYKNKCLKYCTDSCLECLFQDDQYICIRCIKNEKGRQQSLLNNECIDCPENCQLCKPRTQLEIKQINPLFNSTKYLKYTNQCIKSYNDQHYYYDEDLSLFVECQLKLNKDGCFKQIIIQFNLYPDQSSYLNDLNLLQDEQSRIEFKKINKYLKDINSFDHLFSEYENDDFYS